MASIDKNQPASDSDISIFKENIDFKVPDGFIEFYKQSDGADISSDNAYVVLWPITKLIKLNKAYNVEIYAPDFFVFGSDGSDTAYAIERASGHIFEMPFIGMSKEEALFKSANFEEFINGI